MKNTIRKWIRTFEAFRLLNGYNVVAEGKSVFVPYKFDPKTTWNLSKNINVLRRHLEVFEEAREKLRASSRVDVEGKLDSEASHAAFKDSLDKLLESETEVTGLLRIKLEGLNLDHNPIQPGALSDVSDFIDEPVEAPAP